MSLFVTPVTTGDMTTLQNGIQFFTNTSEAITEAAGIEAGADTVQAYAGRLLAANASLSQVAMADTGLMYGGRRYHRASCRIFLFGM